MRKLSAVSYRLSAVSSWLLAVSSWRPTWRRLQPAGSALLPSSRPNSQKARRWTSSTVLRSSVPQCLCAENRELVDRGATLLEIFEPPMNADERRSYKNFLIGVHRRSSAANYVLTSTRDAVHLCVPCPLRALSAFSCAFFSATLRLCGESYAHCGEMVSS